MSADDAQRLFRATFGYDAAHVTSAPGRANLIGEHTDYNEGFVLPFAIPARTYAAVSARTDARARVVSTFASEPVEIALADLARIFPSEGSLRVPEWSAYPLGVVWALMEHAPGTQITGIDIAFSSEVPVGGGLSSSAAIEGATAVAINELFELGADPTTLARAGRRAENEAVGAPTGIMDQMAVMHGRPDAATFLDCRTLEVASVPTGFAEAGLEVLVIDTRVSHAHATGGYRDRRASCEQGAREMGVASLRDLSSNDLPRAQAVLDDVTFRRVRHIVTENQRVIDTVRAFREHGPRAIGELLVASHLSMRDDFEISIAELDVAVDAALAAGAIGARMTGGGFGGSAIALVAHEDGDRVADAVRRAFAEHAFRDPSIFTITASEGARLDV